MTEALLAILVALAIPPALTLRLRRIPLAPVMLRVVLHVVPAVSLPAGLYLLARDGRFVPALLGLAGYLVGAVRAAHLRNPRLTAEASLLHPMLELRDALVADKRAPAPAATQGAPGIDAAEPVVVERNLAAN